MKKMIAPVPEMGALRYGPPASPAGAERSLHSYVWQGAVDRKRPKVRPYRDFFKRLIDVTLVLLSLPFTLPLIGVMAFALWRENGLSFYTQDRLGQNGKTFRILKLRTMVPNAAEALTQHLANNPAARDEWNRLQKLKDDPRVTPVGRILRAASLDELPQLWNVFTGDMSLVGPRPMLPEQLPLYGAPQSYFALRPGITGLWQVSARNSEEFAFRNTADARYEETLSARTDIAILFKTVGVVLRRTGH